MRKVILIIIFSLLLIPNIVKADNSRMFEKGDTISETYIKEIKPDGWYTVHTATTYRRVSDKSLVYCLEHFVNLNSGVYEVNYEDYSKLGLNESQWERIKLLAYYGYNYNNHTDIKWYIVTQVMIWRTVSPENQVYFTDYVNGNRIDKYNNEINEIEDLIIKHYMKPSFVNNVYDTSVGSYLEIIDYNQVLSLFEISNEDFDIIKSFDRLLLKPKKSGSFKLTFKKEDSIYLRPPIIYINPNSQNVFEVGSYSSSVGELNINVTKYHKFKLKKSGSEIDYENKSIKDTPLSEVMFELYKDDLFFKTIGTNIIGEIDLILNNGNYCLKEISTSLNHILDDNLYCFVLSDDNEEYEISIVNELKYSDVYIVKKDFHSKDILEGSKVGIYNLEDELIYELISNEFGKTLKVPLLEGSYYYKEIEAPLGYTLNLEKHYFEVSENDIIELILENKKEIIMPNTGVDNSFSFILIIGCLFFIYGLIKKKKRYLVVCSVLLIFNFSFISPIDTTKHLEALDIGYDIPYYVKENDYVYIPSLEMKKEIKEGTSDSILKDYVGILDNGYDFNNNGNLVLAGHNDYNTFGRLKKLDIGDIIEVYKSGVKYKYRINHRKIVSKDNVDDLYNISDSKQITLVTCINNNVNRLILKGEIYESDND